MGCIVASTRVVVDLELGRGFGYGLHELGIAGFQVAVTWSDVVGFIHWPGDTGRALLGYLLQHDEVVGFNLLAYDNAVLAGYLLPAQRGIAGLLKERTLDLHAMLYRATGRRHSLQSVAQATLGEGKLTPPTDDDPILFAEYCQRDVELTRDLDDYRRQYGWLYTGTGEAVMLSEVLEQYVAGRAAR